jgi:hypothetical protein
MADQELRCGNTMHGILREGRYLEVKCKRRPCGAKPGVVVLHIFDLTTGLLTGTKRYRDPHKMKGK